MSTVRKDQMNLFYLFNILFTYLTQHTLIEHQLYSQTCTRCEIPFAWLSHLKPSYFSDYGRAFILIITLEHP